MEFTVARRADGPARMVGLHEAERYDSVLDIERCLLQSGPDERAPRTRRAPSSPSAALTVYEQETGEGLLRFLMLREGRQTGEADGQRGDVRARGVRAGAARRARCRRAMPRDDQRAS